MTHHETNDPAGTDVWDVGVPQTFGSGPSDPIRLADEPGTWVEVHVAAPRSRVWEFVTDIDLPAQFSEEFQGATWDGDGPTLGATFTGRNRNDFLGEWEVECRIDVFEPPTAFGWSTVDPESPGSRWRFELRDADSSDADSSGGGTVLRYSVSLGPGWSGISIAIASAPEKEPRILRGRLIGLHRNMVATVHGIKGLAEPG